MLENKNKVQEEVEDLTVGNIKRSRTMSNDSGSSNDAGSHGTSHQVSLFVFFSFLHTYGLYVSRCPATETISV